MAIPRPVTKTKIATVSWGIPITDEVNRLTGLVNAQAITPWTPVTFQNGWTNGGGAQPVQYRKVGDIVYVRGAAVPGSFNTTMFALPVGFRPPALMHMGAAGWTGAAPVPLYWQFTPDGSVVCYGASATQVPATLYFSTI